MRRFSRTHYVILLVAAGLVLLTVIIFALKQRSHSQTNVGPYVPSLPGVTRDESNVTTTSLDLDGDRRLESITLSHATSDSLEQKTILGINGDEIEVPGENSEGVIHIVDLDPTDHRKEVAIGDVGPSDDYITSFYRFSGNDIQFLGTIPGLVSQMKFIAKNKLLTNARAHILDTWFYEVGYELRGDTLVPITKSFYARQGEKVTVLQSLPLQTSSKNTRIAFTLNTGDIVSIIGCDDVAWCEVENSKKQHGWFEITGFDQIKSLGKAASEVFSGLSQAD